MSLRIGNQLIATVGDKSRENWVTVWYGALTNGNGSQMIPPNTSFNVDWKFGPSGIDDPWRGYSERHHVLKHAVLIMCSPYLQMRTYSGGVTRNLQDLFPNIGNAGVLHSSASFAQFTVTRTTVKESSGTQQLKVIGNCGAEHIISYPAGGSAGSFYIHNPRTAAGEIFAYGIVMVKLHSEAHVDD